ncbi:MAG: hypothetical protein ACYC4L_15130 [Chloroflexota bacterium]
MVDKKKRRITCDPIAHKNHLCYLVAHRRMAKAQALVGDGRYLCTLCRRRAADPENLCEPRLAERSA